MLKNMFETVTERIAGKALCCFLTSFVMLLVTLPLLAADKEKDEDTLRKPTWCYKDWLTARASRRICYRRRTACSFCRV